MKTVGEMTIGELAAFVCTHLEKNGINVVLSGGACVSLFTENEYQSFDLDFIENVVTSRKRIREVLQKIGFIEEHRYYKHPDTDFFLEFPPGPLSIGDEPVREIMEKEFSTGVLRLLSPTDCVKDRLAAYYHWNDRQSLQQATLVARTCAIDLDEIERWSIKEGKSREFSDIRERLRR
ncbi:MAG TPA: hypothetical protein VN416_06615 [Desulfomonilia bacterium]|nr:hypothetical protein [Desulfomonilia bacterium]